MPEYLPWSGLAVNMKCIFFNKKKSLKKNKKQKTITMTNQMHIWKDIDFLIYKLNIFKNTIRNQVQL